jgi:hypothetical protein
MEAEILSQDFNFTVSFTLSCLSLSIEFGHIPYPPKECCIFFPPSFRHPNNSSRAARSELSSSSLCSFAYCRIIIE